MRTIAAILTGVLAVAALPGVAMAADHGHGAGPPIAFVRDGFGHGHVGHHGFGHFFGGWGHHGWGWGGWGHHGWGWGGWRHHDWDDWHHHSYYNYYPGYGYPGFGIYGCYGTTPYYTYPYPVAPPAYYPPPGYYYPSVYGYPAPGPWYGRVNLGFSLGIHH